MKTVFITGASGNLGAATVEKFLQEGYKVIATVTPGRTLGYDAKGEIEIYEADLTDEKSVDNVLVKVVTKHKNIDAALLLVGGYASGGLTETDGTLLRKMISLNFETAYFVCRPLFQQMMQQENGGRIIMVGARPALRAKEANRSLGYALSKSLIFKLADALNVAGSDNNVTASVIVPSTIDTPSNREAMPKADFTKWVAPEEIAAAMTHLCSSATKSWRDSTLKIYGRS
jgi:NAD(P)-dependent dehydrogenase (short-subunit alcohol dehydrogenase family)